MAAEKGKIHHLFKNIDSEMELLLTLGQYVSTEFDLNKLLQLVADSAREVIQAETLVVPIIDYENQQYTYYSSSGENAGIIKGKSFPMTVGMCGWVLSNQQPLLFGLGSDLPIGDKTAWEEGMQSALLVPMISRGKIIGGLSGLGKKNNRSFTKRDLELLTLFANQTSTAVENAQILNELHTQQEKLQNLLESTQFEKELAEVTLEAIVDAVVITDTSGIVINANTAGLNISGCQLRDVVGRPIRECIRLHLLKKRCWR